MVAKLRSRFPDVLLRILFLLITLFQVKAQCFNDTTKRCDFALNTSLYLPSSSQLNALDDLNQIHDHVFFMDERCDKAIDFAACYWLRIPCVDSLARPICIEDCIVAETILKYSCATDFRFILAVNNMLSHTLEQFDCHRPESYISGTTEYSADCLPLVKLRAMFKDDITEYEASIAPTTSPTMSSPDDGSVVAIVMLALVGTACIVVFSSMLLWYCWKRRKQHRYSEPITPVIVNGHSPLDKLNVYDDSITSHYTDVEVDDSVESSY